MQKKDGNQTTNQVLVVGPRNIAEGQDLLKRTETRPVLEYVGLNRSKSTEVGVRIGLKQLSTSTLESIKTKEDLFITRPVQHALPTDMCFQNYRKRHSNCAAGAILNPGRSWKFVWSRQQSTLWIYIKLRDTPFQAQSKIAITIHQIIRENRYENNRYSIIYLLFFCWKGNINEKNVK